MFADRLKTTDIVHSRYVFLLPIGSTEQHGPFGPLGTDTFILDEIVKRAALPDDILILPTLPYSCAEEHRGFPGSIWLRTETFANVLEDVCRSLEDCARMLCIVSWHGGNDEILKESLSLLNEHVDIEVVLLDIMDEKIDQKTENLLNGPIDDHAGNTELSMVKAINANLVTNPPSDYKKQRLLIPLHMTI